MLPELITPIPGPDSRSLAGQLSRFESQNTTFISERFPVFWARAKGTNVWDVDGNRYLDLTSGFGVASLGFTPDEVVAAIHAQAPTLYHAMGDVHPTREKVQLCTELSRLTFEKWDKGPGKTILTNSGSEAVEAALKTAWLATGRSTVLAFDGSYHGLGFGSLTATGRRYFRDPFQAQLPDWARFVPFPHCLECPNNAAAETSCLATCRPKFIQAVQEVMKSEPIGAILVEPIQGRGGEVVPPTWLLPALRELANQFGAILIFDEIYTGFYRTGPRFACDEHKVVPDLICLGKALTSGFPLAACVGRADLMDYAWPKSTGESLQTSTFLGNPLGCRMALTALELLEKGDWEPKVRALETHLADRLNQLRKLSEHWGPRRGRGLMQGLEILSDGKPDPALAGHLVEEMLAKGIIILNGGTQQNVLSFTPPFTITPGELSFAVEQLAALGG